MVVNTFRKLKEQLDSLSDTQLDSELVVGFTEKDKEMFESICFHIHDGIPKFSIITGDFVLGLVNQPWEQRNK